MLAVLIFACYLAGGVFIAEKLFSDKSPLLRIWLGGSLGILLLMWLPALIAFVYRFDLLGQGVSLGILALLCICAQLFCHNQTRKPWDSKETRTLYALLLVVLPFVLLSFYLQYTHTLREVNGTLHVGQTTYGDLCLHLSIATSLRGVSFPPEYALLPGTRLGYPFLTDTLSTSLLLWGMPLNWAFILPGTAMMALVYSGILLLGREMTGRLREAVVVLLLLLCCGGLGFLYDWDMAARDPSRIIEIFDGFYKAPANQPDLNLRWSNILVDLFLPQRTFLGGWTLLLPALYLLMEAMRTRSVRLFVILGIWAGSMPLVHTHSFLALALFSAGMVIYTLCTRHTEELVGPEAKYRSKLSLLCLLGIYLGIAVALALPQLIAFTFQQASSEHFLRFQFNWVNNPGGKGLIDTYLFFWVKNAGLPILLMIAALLDTTPKQRQVACGAFTIFIVAELILFQPNEYDNNKLFYVWFLLMLPMTAACGLRMYDKLRGMRARVWLAVLFMGASVLSGGLSIAREVISDYEIFSAADVALAEYVEKNTPADALIMTGTQHNNPVTALAGRKVVCGPSLYLYFHGLDYSANEQAVQQFYQDPAAGLSILEEYGATYVLLSDDEWNQYTARPAVFDALFDCVFNEGGVRLYAVREAEEVPVSAPQGTQLEIPSEL